MLMPETAVDEQDSSQAGKNDIWPAGQIGTVEPETEAQAVRDLADGEFRFGIA